MLKKQKVKEETESEVAVGNVVMVEEIEKDVMMVALEVTDVHLEEILETEVTEVIEEVLVEEIEEVLSEEVLMVQDQDDLKDLDLVIPVRKTEVKEAALIVQDPDVQLLLVIREVLKDQDQEGQNLNPVQEVQTDQDVQDVKLFC